MNAIERFNQRRESRLTHRMQAAESTEERDRLTYALYRNMARTDGGPGSGNHGHVGNPGKRGGSMPTKFGNCTSTKRFSKDIDSAKVSVDNQRKGAAWRVASHTPDELNTEYGDVRMHTTNKGSTCAIAENGDIVSVCRVPHDYMSGKQLLQFAVDNGGTKLDSFTGNHEFYTQCGFEPVSWCKWSDDYADPGWLKANGIKEGDDSWKKKSNEELAVPREDIIFYKYTGNTDQTETATDFKRRVKASEDYDTARDVRDATM